MTPEQIATAEKIRLAKLAWFRDPANREKHRERVLESKGLKKPPGSVEGNLRLQSQKARIVGTQSK